MYQQECPYVEYTNYSHFNNFFNLTMTYRCFNFTNILLDGEEKINEIDPRCQFHQHSMSSFCACRSQKHKKDTDDLTILFTLSGSMSAKAVHRTLMKLTPGVNFTHIL